MFASLAAFDWLWGSDHDPVVMNSLFVTPPYATLRALNTNVISKKIMEVLASTEVAA